MNDVIDSQPGEIFAAGIDGGGSKTQASLARRNQSGEYFVLGRGTAGPTNLRSLAPAEAWDRCRLAVEQAFAEAGIAPRRLDGIALAMAGAGSEPIRRAFETEVMRASAIPRVVVTHDARPLIAGGTGGDSGIALIAGTGSMAYCRTEAGTEDRCGGWGYLFGDEGSGYALAIAGLRAAVTAWDGRGEPTELLRALRDWIGESDIMSWPTLLQSRSRRDVAEGAGIVIDVAAGGDAAANRLVDQAAGDLARLITTLQRRCFGNVPVDLVFAGSLLVRNESMQQRVLRRFISQGGRPRGLRTIEHPADGALCLLDG